MEEWSGKESYEGYFKRVQKILIDRLSDGLEELVAQGLDITSRQGYYLWAIDNVPELEQGERRLLEQLGKVWFAGEAAGSFDTEHFENYQVIVQEWGSVTNKIFNRYFKAMEALIEVHGEQVSPGQMSLGGLEQEGAQVGVGF